MPMPKNRSSGSKRPNYGRGRGGHGKRTTYVGGTGGVKRGYATRLRSNPERKKQVFDYMLVLDFECTCEMGDKSWPHEIIEFPVCLLDLNTLEIVAEFHRYVRPVRNPTLTAFCRNLTGITQDQVDNSDPLPVVMKEFEQWYHQNVYEKVLSPEKFPNPDDRKKVIFATDTISDINNFLFRMAAGRDKVHVPDYFREYVDIRATFHFYFKPKYKLKLPGMLREMRLRFQGKEHSGIDDTRNICYLIKAMIEYGCLFCHTNKIRGGRGTSDYHLDGAEGEDAADEVAAELGDDAVEAVENGEDEEGSQDEEDETEDKNESEEADNQQNAATETADAEKSDKKVQDNAAKKVEEKHTADPIKAEFKRQQQLKKESATTASASSSNPFAVLASPTEPRRKTKKELREEAEELEREEDEKQWALMEAARDSMQLGGGKGKKKQHTTNHKTNKAIQKSLDKTAEPAKPAKTPMIKTREFTIRSDDEPQTNAGTKKSEAVKPHHSTAIASSTALLESRARMGQTNKTDNKSTTTRNIMLFVAILLFNYIAYRFIF